MTPTRDVIIIGCGPGGSTAANLLAAAGHDVLVLEKAVFPRFHVGESLLPVDLPLYERLGVQMEKGPFQPKLGAEFLKEDEGAHRVYTFDGDVLEGTPTRAWQAERAVFDDMLARRAAELGADIRFGVTVTEVEFQDDHVSVRAGSERLRGRFLIDASGQDAFLAKRGRTREPIHGLGRAAAFCHFEGLSPEVVAELAPTGNVKVFMLPHGWMWAIPLTGGRLSVGTVSAKGKLEVATLERAIADSALMQRLTAGASRTPIRLIGNFSYRNTRARGERFGCIGDAACFLDPVFSSGVTLAMQGGARVADLLSPALREGREGDADLLDPASTALARAYTVFEQMIRRFYHTRLVNNLVFGDAQREEIRRGLVSIVAGDVWRDDNVFQALLERSHRFPSSRRPR